MAMEPSRRLVGLSAQYRARIHVWVFCEVKVPYKSRQHIEPRSSLCCCCCCWFYWLAIASPLCWSREYCGPHLLLLLLLVFLLPAAGPAQTNAHSAPSFPPEFPPISQITTHSYRVLYYCSSSCPSTLLWWLCVCPKPMDQSVVGPFAGALVDWMFGFRRQQHYDRWCSGRQSKRESNRRIWQQQHSRRTESLNRTKSGFQLELFSAA